MRSIPLPTIDMPQRETWSRWLRAGIRQMWRAWLLHRAAKATAAALHGLDDRMLHDIGLDRSEIGSVAAALTLDDGPGQRQVRTALCSSRHRSGRLSDRGLLRDVKETMDASRPA